MNGKSLIVTSAIFLTISLGGCKNETPQSTMPPGGAPPPTAMAPAGEPFQADSGRVITGKVLESLDASGYSYLKMDVAGEETWVALPKMDIGVGEEVSVVYSMEMHNFESKALGKTFDKVIFASGLASDAPPGGAPLGEAPPEGEAGSVEGQKADSFAAAVESEGGETAVGGAPPSGGSGSAVVPFTDVKVEKAEGENGVTIAELYEKKDELNGKDVKVRGKVVKVSQQIMQTNWIHLQDGTGNPMDNTHDLVVTSDAIPEKDTVITVSGKVIADKDFGAGYKYAVIIEQAEIVQ